MIFLGKFSARRGLLGRLPAISPLTTERLLTGQSCIEDREFWKVWLDQLVKIISQEEFTLTLMSTENSFREAIQVTQITGAMLHSSDDPNGVEIADSVLDTESQNKYPFNWWSGVRHSTIMLAPGKGVPTTRLVFNPDYIGHDRTREIPVADSTEFLSVTVARPYGIEGGQLQFGQILPHEGRWQFWPSSLEVDSFIHLSQIIPSVEMP
jgi:hypothetical protein